MTSASAIGGQFISPSNVAIFAQPPGPGGAFVPLLLTQASIPSPGRVAFDLSETEDYEQTWSVPRNPVERFTAQNRIRNPGTLSVTGMLSATPLFSLLQNVGIARLDKRALLKLGTLLKASICFIVTPERPYRDMACVSFRQHWGPDTGKGVELSLRFSEFLIASPLSVAPELDVEALALGASSAGDAGAQTATDVVDPGSVG